jgi:phage protein D
MSTLRKPRAWLVVEGQSIPVLECEVSVHRHQSADSFSATISLSRSAAQGMDAGFWADKKSVKAEIKATNGEGGNPGGGTTLVKGSLDQVEISFDKGTVHVNGRDRTKELLDKKSREKFQDRTASDIVKEVAGRHGLTVQEDSTQDKAGKQYVRQHDRISDHESEWSLIVALAEREGKVAYIKGDTLYFTAPGNNDSEGGSFTVRYSPPSPQQAASGNFVRLRCLRNLALSGEVKVEVQSFDRRQKKVITGKKESGGGGEGNPVEYNYRIPGLSQSEADAIADKKLQENTKHEKVIEIEMPGDTSVDPRMMLQLQGTQSSFDQSYFIDSIRHMFGFHIGYEMLITARNKDKGRS